MTLVDELRTLFSNRHVRNNPDNPKIKPASIKKYLMSIQLIAKALGVEFVNLDFLKEPKKVFKVIENLSEAVKASRLLAPMLITEMMPEYNEYHDEYSKMHKSISRPLATKFKNGIQTDKTKKNMITWREVVDILKSHKKSADKIYKQLSADERKPKPHEAKTIREYVAGMLFAGSIDLPPRRAEYGDVEIIKNAAYKKLKDKDTSNYLVLGTKPFFHFANYKSILTEGPIDIPVPVIVMKVLRKWIPIQNSKYLFANHSGEKPLGFQEFSGLLKRAFSTPTKNIGVNILRHAFITEYIKEDHDEHKDIASKMGHDVNTQKGYIANSD